MISFGSAAVALYIFVRAITSSQGVTLHSRFCADPQEVTWNFTFCPVVEDLGIRSVNSTLNTTLCSRKEAFEKKGIEMNENGVKVDVHIPLQLQIEEYSVMLKVNVTCELWQKTSAQRRYLLRYYEWNSFVLSDLIVSEKNPPCSLWAKKNYIDKVPSTTRRYFETLCESPKNITYRISECPPEDE
uniref:Lipocalin n=1 Tax=Rhipicephalus appendiculatus TaxID=34631 RepID=A0A131Z5Q3_RHIAP